MAGGRIKKNISKLKEWGGEKSEYARSIFLPISIANFCILCSHWIYILWSHWQSYLCAPRKLCSYPLLHLPSPLLCAQVLYLFLSQVNDCHEHISPTPSLVLFPGSLKSFYCKLVFFCIEYRSTGTSLNSFPVLLTLTSNLDYWNNLPGSPQFHKYPHDSQDDLPNI